ncbi:MAG: helix-turn-helix transcriptional regulator, partial [Oligoflexia bacterium]|nr:helix-turn-helix transcriptional regulator [Oligoflexia bacterium]
DGGELDADGGELDADGGELDADGGELTEVERGLIAQLGSRPRREKLWMTILVLLRRRPMRPTQLAEALGGRSVRKLVDKHLSPMLDARLIKRTNPDAPTDPNQAYYAVEGYQGPPAGPATPEEGVP